VPAVKGFAVGRTLWNGAAAKWFAGDIDDRAAVDDIAAGFARLTAAWARRGAGGA